MTRIIVKLSVGVAAAVATLLVAVPALAYVVGAASFLTAPAVEPGGVAFTITADFIQPSGAPFPAGVTVTFSEASGPVTATNAHTGTTGVVLMAAVQTTCEATFSPATTATSSSGTASSTVVLPTGCPGDYVLQATAAGSTTAVSATVDESSASSAAAAAPGAPAAPAGAFPNTTTMPPGASGSPWVSQAVGFFGSAALLIAVIGFMFWRQRRSHREA